MIPGWCSKSPSSNPLYVITLSPGSSKSNNPDSSMMFTLEILPPNSLDKKVSTPLVGFYFLLSDVYSFNSLSSCVVCLHLLHCGCFPVYLVLCLLCVFSNPIHVIPFDCSCVLAQSFLQRSSSFSNVHAIGFSTGYLVHISSFLMLVVAPLAVPGLCGVFL